MTIWGMWHSLWVPKSTHTQTCTHTHKICNTYCLFTATVVAQTSLNAMLYVHACVVIYFLLYTSLFFFVQMNIIFCSC